MSSSYDPAIIGEVSTESAFEGSGPTKFNHLRNKCAQIQDENERLKEEKSIESQKAKLLIPYANKVFYFCCTYTSFAFGMLFLHGCTSIDFHLAESTKNHIAGSNPASIIGLIVTIMTGLLRSK